MTPEGIAEWEQAFKDMEDSINALYESEKKPPKKVDKKSTSIKKKLI